MSSLLDRDNRQLETSAEAREDGFRLATAWRFTIVRLLAFSTVTAASFAFVKSMDDQHAAVLAGLFWLAGSLICLRAGNMRDTLMLLATAFGIVFVLGVLLAALLAF